MAYGTVNADVIGTSTGYNLGAGNASIMKNRIINGGCVIDQRNAGASVTPSSGGYTYTVDRFAVYATQSSKLTAQQNAGSVTPPVGFVSYLGITSSSAYSVSSSDIFMLVQKIEGYNIADLNWGTSNGKSVTLSFQVYSSLTGTFGGSIFGPSGATSYPFSYTISSANTWTTISVNIPAPPNGTSFNSNNSIGFSVAFGLGVGSSNANTAGTWVTSGSQAYSATGATSVVGTNGATFYITGVQLEVGSSATGFEYRQYGQELALCQRYYYTTGSVAPPLITGHCRSTTAADYQLPLKVTMRSAPTLSTVNSGAYMQVAGSNYTITSINAQDSSIPDVLTFRGNVASGLTAGYASVFGGGTATYINASAEL